MVPAEGVEPTHPYGYQILSLARLPIPPRWRPFPRVPHLLQYIRSGQYYARTRVNGKIIRRSHEDSVVDDREAEAADVVR